MKADQLAKEARESMGEIVHTLPKSDIKSLINDETNIIWQQWWDETSKEKGAFLKFIKPRVSRHPWFQKDCSERKVITSLCRLRVNHNSLPYHLHRIGVKENKCCDCNNNLTGDTNHLLLECDLVKEEREELYKEIIKLKIALPTNAKEILKYMGNHKRIKNVLKTNKIKV